MVPYEPFSDAYRRDPYPTYRALREHDPVHWAPDAAAFCVSRYDDVQHVLKHPELFSSRAMATVMMPRGFLAAPLHERLRGLVRFLWISRMSPFRRQAPTNLITEDAPRHDVMRAIVNRGFSPRRVSAWEPRIREIVAECVGRLETAEIFDVVEDLAVPVPVTIIAEMLGVEPERRADFKRWSDAIIRASTGSARSGAFPHEMITAVAELYRYLRGILRKQRQSPQDDLIGVLVGAGEGDAGVLDEMEVLQFVLLLLVAGNETTTNLMGNAISALLAHPETLARVAADPGLVPAVLEETLRWDAPIQYLFRVATRDTEIAGTPVRRGQLVCPILASANRDATRFEDPESFRIDRDPRGHLAFGFGVHFCLGASLARLEARAALEALVPVLPRLQPADAGPPALVDSFLVRGPSRLELRATPSVP